MSTLSNLWPNRSASMAHLSAKHPSRLRLLERCIANIDECIDAIERLARNSSLAKALALTAIKGKNVALCNLGLICDGYGQESGAMLRLLVEYTELLIYLSRFPEKAQDALNDDLPKAGKRAAAVEGKFKFVRDFLNENSSHGSFSEHAVGHLVRQNGTLIKSPRFNPTTFDTNFRMGVVFTLFLYREMVGCIETLDRAAFNEHAEKCDRLMARSKFVLNLKEDLAGAQKAS